MPEISELQIKAKERTVKTQTVEYDLQSLVRRIKKKSIKLDPTYQRRHRWSDVVSSRLIESLLLNIPIPTIYLSQDVDIDDENEAGLPTFSVIDGQQRLSAILNFLDNKLTLVGLEVLPELNKMRYMDLPSFLKRRLEDRSLTCLRIDSTVDSQVKYDIFERLNSGSVQLTPQELRNAVYRGAFNEMIQELAREPEFKKIARISSSREEKMEDAELVLRFFALSNDRYKSYKPNMKEFLNNSMSTFSKCSTKELDSMKRQFHTVMTAVSKGLGDEPFTKSPATSDGRKSKFSTAVYDAVCISFDNILRSGNTIPEDASDALMRLFREKSFQNSISGSINDGKKLLARISLVENAFRK